MRKVLCFVVIAVIICIAFALFVNNNIDKEANAAINRDLVVADSLMFIKPDSSLAVLNAIDDQSSRFDSHNRALHALLLSQARARNYIKAENDSLIKVALGYYANSNDSIRKAWAYVYASDVYMELDNYKLALEYIHEASEIATGCYDNRLLSFIYYYWGRLLQDEKPYDEAINKILLSENYARQLNDTSMIVYRLKDAGWICLYKKDYERATNLFNQAIDLAEQAKLYYHYSLLYQKLSLILYRKKQYDESLEYSTKAIKYINYTSDSLKIYAFRGRILIRLNQLDSARYYTERGKSEATFYNKANYEDEMALIEEGLGNYKKALKHRTQYASYLDSIKKEENDRRVMTDQKRYDFAKVKIENDRLKIANQRKEIYLLIGVIVLLIASIAIYIIFMFFRKRSNTMIATKDRMLSQSIKQVQSKSAELVAEKHNFQEKELELLSDITDKEVALSRLMQEQRDLKDAIFKMNDVVKRIEEIKAMPLKNKFVSPMSLMLNDKDFESLIDSINLCYDGFIENLNRDFPSLTKDDLYLCSLLIMGVENRNIAILLNINAGALKKRKYRLKNEKLFTEEPIPPYLSSFFAKIDYTNNV